MEPVKGSILEQGICTEIVSDLNDAFLVIWKLHSSKKQLALKQ